MISQGGGAVNFRNPTFLRSTWSAQGIAGKTAAFAGRSNAGKSSTLNALCDGRFARVARTPGRTRMINLFELAGGSVLADLPGYGYAAAAKEEQQSWGTKASRFLAARQICGVVLVVDCRRGLLPVDSALLRMVASRPALVLMNKSDKLGREARQRCMKEARRALAEILPHAEALEFSALRKIGVEEARNIVGGWLA